jgi:putative membrane protein
MLLERQIPLGYIYRSAWRDFLVVLGISVCGGVLVEYERSYLPDLPVAIAAFLGTAISLILSFKLNQTYDRWWEARKVWGAVVNDSRTLVRQALAFTSDVPDDDGELATMVRTTARRQIAWCYCLGQSLRGLDWRTHTAQHLDEDDLAELERHGNRPVAILQLHARSLAALAARGALTDYQRVAMDETLTRLTDSMGMAERIRNTVFPKTYRMFLKAFIYVFITVLSISLGEVEGYWEIAVTTAISTPFLLLERTSRLMQDPFANRPTDTPVTAIARAVEINILQLLGEDDVPEPYPPNAFYLM